MLFEELKRQNLIERLAARNVKVTKEGKSIYKATYRDLKWTLAYLMVGEQ